MKTELTRRDLLNQSAKIGSTLALTAGSLADWLSRNASFQRWQQRVSGTILVTVAVWLALRRE